MTTVTGFTGDVSIPKAVMYARVKKVIQPLTTGVRARVSVDIFGF